MAVSKSPNLHNYATYQNLPQYPQRSRCVHPGHVHRPLLHFYHILGLIEKADKSTVSHIYSALPTTYTPLSSSWHHERRAGLLHQPTPEMQMKSMWRAASIYNTNTLHTCIRSWMSRGSTGSTFTLSSGWNSWIIEISGWFIYQYSPTSTTTPVTSSSQFSSLFHVSITKCALSALACARKLSTMCIYTMCNSTQSYWLLGTVTGC